VLKPNRRIQLADCFLGAILPELDEISRMVGGQHMEELPSEIANVQVVGVVDSAASVTEEGSKFSEILRVLIGSSGQHCR
jgi:hypothetical protein